MAALNWRIPQDDTPVAMPSDTSASVPRGIEAVQSFLHLARSWRNCPVVGLPRTSDRMQSRVQMPPRPAPADWLDAIQCPDVVRVSQRGRRGNALSQSTSASSYSPTSRRHVARCHSIVADSAQAPRLDQGSQARPRPAQAKHGQASIGDARPKPRHRDGAIRSGAVRPRSDPGPTAHFPDCSRRRLCRLHGIAASNACTPRPPGQREYYMPQLLCASTMPGRITTTPRNLARLLEAATAQLGIAPLNRLPCPPSAPSFA